ncbi:hypothetical protein Cgig2_023372 [Carnegiea gigantea]|uniref:RNA polymerase sigma-70 region 4 domain-containing protein n=1 Tax=Carnegiea gigantea TaxID=171969 RepID=A0A9Q1JGT5_9CARY|nr:hypothetical protein Cgig2_023372 [Carnegiea gigantea]
MRASIASSVADMLRVGARLVDPCVASQELSCKRKPEIRKQKYCKNAENDYCKSNAKSISPVSFMPFFFVWGFLLQGISRALTANSRIVRLPSHLRARLSLIHNAKNKLQAKGITPSLDRIAECLNMSHKKIMNAMEYIADNHLENNPWHGVRELALKLEVNNLIDKILGEREKYIIRLYYGLDDECLSWEEISKRISLSRERVRQVGLVAVEKLKQAARKRRMEALLVER